MVSEAKKPRWPPTAGEMSSNELKARLESGDRPFLLDVRNPEEILICRIEGATLIPLPELPKRLDELDRNREIVVHCKSGGRSAKAVDLLKAAGFDRVANLSGGILGWIDAVDPSLNRY